MLLVLLFWCERLIDMLMPGICEMPLMEYLPFPVSLPMLSLPLFLPVDLPMSLRTAPTLRPCFGVRPLKFANFDKKPLPPFFCWDMDFFDPSCAPGVCTPTWGGVSAREGLAILQRLRGLDIVAFDVNTVSPPHDVGGMTAFLAGTVMLECMVLACHALGLAG